MDMPTFDEFRDLLQRDPDGFEALRAQLIEDCIGRSSLSNQRRLRGLQFVIDARRRVASTPVKALMDIQAMMYDSLFALQQALLVEQGAVEPSVMEPGRVLDFRRPVSPER
ncbi:MAG: DUF3135 domain-containing protein [Pseudomonadota bacterium]